MAEMVRHEAYDVEIPREMYDDIRNLREKYAALEAQLAERVSRRRAIAEAIISASNCTGDTLAVDGNHLILVPADGAVTINLLKLAKALSALEATPTAPKVTEAPHGWTTQADGTLRPKTSPWDGGDTYFAAAQEAGKP